MSDRDDLERLRELKRVREQARSNAADRRAEADQVIPAAAPAQEVVASPTESPRDELERLRALKTPGQKDIAALSGESLPQPSFSETLQIFRTDDIEGNLGALGFNVIPELDEISGEEISTPVLKLERDGEQFELDINSIRNQLISGVRSTAQAAGGLAGGTVGFGLPAPGTTALGSILGGAAAGQAVDLVADFFSGQGLGQEAAIEQAKQDLLQETVFGLGGEVAGRALKPVIEGAVDIARRTPADAAPRIEPTISVDAPASPVPAGARDIGESAQAVSRADIPAIAADVQPRPEVALAAREEGFDLTPDQLSGNPAFIELSQAAKSTPGSTLAADEIRNINKLGQSLDELKARVGGDIDKAAVNQNVASEFTSMVKKLEAQEKPLYESVKKSIPVASTHIPSELMGAVNREAERVGGKQNLRGVWKQVNDELIKNMPKDAAGSPTSPEVTYGFIDDLRKEVGSGYKGQGSFKDARTGQLDQAYRALSQEQQNIAQSFGEGVASDMRLARKLSAERIGIQKNAVKFGKDLVDKEGVITDGPFVHKLEGAVKNLANGNTKQFDDLMAALPESQRAAVAISAVDPLLSASRLQSGKVTGTMANAGRALNRNKTAKDKLYRHLPKEEAKRLDNLFTISDGIFSSVERQNVSRTARDVLAAMDDQLSPIKKLYNVGRGAGRLVSPGASTAADLGENAVKNITKEKSSTASAADSLLSSGKFNSALNEFINEGQFQAQRKVMAMPEYKRWLKTLPNSQREEVERIGLFNWMFRVGEGAVDAAESAIEEAQ